MTRSVPQPPTGHSTVTVAVTTVPVPDNSWARLLSGRSRGDGRQSSVRRALRRGVQPPDDSKPDSMGRENKDSCTGNKMVQNLILWVNKNILLWQQNAQNINCYFRFVLIPLIHLQWKCSSCLSESELTQIEKLEKLFCHAKLMSSRQSV